MNVIWKFPLEIVKEQEIETPAEAMFLTLQSQNNIPTFWVYCNPEREKVKTKIYCFGTGVFCDLSDKNPNAFSLIANNKKYLGTVQIDGLVWHYFMSHAASTS